MSVLAVESGFWKHKTEKREPLDLSFAFGLVLSPVTLVLFSIFQDPLHASLAK